MSIFTKTEQIPLFRYGMIMIDPPWLFKAWSIGGNEKNALAQYDCWTLDRVKALRVGEWAAPDCLLWLWACNPLLPEAIEVLDAWGFTFKTAGHWSKKTVSGAQSFGTGYILRSAGEPFLIGTIGKPKTARNVRSVIEGVAREHSRKPEEAYVAAEQLCQNVDRLDAFSRQARPGWDSFGDEIGKFDNSEAA